MTPNHLVFWQNLLSPHQSAWVRALADRGHAVTVVAPEPLSPERRALGWEVPTLGTARVVCDPGLDEIHHLVEAAGSEALHIMAGARWTDLGYSALRACLARPRPPRLAVLSEAPDPRGLRGWARQWKYAFEFALQGRHYDVVLAIGHKAPDWFRECGYPAHRIFPFCYTAESIEAEGSPNGNGGTCSKDAGEPASHSGSRPPEILYVGRLQNGKGVDLLLRAFAEAKLGRVRLGLVGNGPARDSLQGLAVQLGIAGALCWFGSRPAAETRAMMARAQLTVLPSRQDGWGTVVNESLMAGTPVVCTAACGAAALLRGETAHTRGTVVPSEDVPALTAALRAWSQRFPIAPAARTRIRAWARRIEGPAVADYFQAVLQHVYEFPAPRPLPPWGERRSHVA